MEQTYAAKLEEAREAAGLSFAQVHMEVRDRLGAYCPTLETIRLWHKRVPKQVDLVVLMAIVDVYGLKLSDVGVNIPRATRELIRRSSGWMSGTLARAS